MRGRGGAQHQEGRRTWGSGKVCKRKLEGRLRLPHPKGSIRGEGARDGVKGGLRESVGNVLRGGTEMEKRSLWSGGVVYRQKAEEKGE